MGTTSRNLRYPEGTALGNQMHTRIKELADDTTTQLNALKIEVLGRQNIQQAHSGGTFSNSGTDFPYGLQTLTIPTGTEIIDLFAHVNASATANAAAYHYLQVRTASGSWFNLDAHRAHNNVAAYTDVGATMFGTTSPSELGNPTTFQVRMVINVDVGGAALTLGPTHYNAVYKRVN